MVSPGNVIAQSMLDRSRIALCMMMLAVFAFNPFGKFLSHADSAVTNYSKPSGRVILGTGAVAILIKFYNEINIDLFSDQTMSTLEMNPDGFSHSPLWQSIYFFS